MHLNHIAPPLESQEAWKKRINKMWAGGWEHRRKYIGEHAWCILTQECADRLGRFLGKFNNVIEVFAGTGYIANHLREASGLGRKYRAYDPCRSHWKEDQRPNYGFTRKGCFNVNLKKADCVVMCWPNYAQDLAYRIARKMVSGQTLIYQGEGWGGCTGDDDFHEYLDTNFHRLEARDEMINDKHVQWDGIHDYWHIYVKK